MKINFLNKDFFLKNHKSILIYNPLSNVGHFDSWCKIFVVALLNKGWNVCVVTNNTKIFLGDIYIDNKFDLSKLLLIDKNTVFHEQAVLKFSDFLFSKIRFIKFNSADNKLSTFFKKIFIFITNTIYTIIQKIFKTRVSISFTDPREFARDVELISNTLGGSPTIVLNMYLDLYDSNSKIWDKFTKLMNFDWVAIHMDSTHTLIGKPFSKSKSLKAIFNINEPVSIQPLTSFKFKSFWLPDATDTSLPKFESKLAQDILQKARGRNILFLGGAIGGTKNLSLWAELICISNPECWFFVLVGKIDFQTLSSADLSGLEQLRLNNPDNVYFCDTYLDDESIFNELISISTVVWGVYRDFDRSSNILTKAALFSKPIVVSKSYLMGQRVIQYKIGYAVSESNVLDVLNAINLLITNPIHENNFKNYAAVYSKEALAVKLDQSLMSVI